MLSPMARGRRRGPLLLRFRALLVSLNLHAAKVVDTRQASKVRYSLQDCYVCGFALFYLQDPSVLEFQRRFQDQLRTNNLNATFGVARIPADSQFRDLLDSHDYEPLLGCFGDWIGRMQDAKWLQHYQFLDGRYLITMDGSQYFSSYKVNCECCLTATNNGTVRYHHDILQTAIVHPDKRQVLPLAPVFIHNADDSGAKSAKRRKQDCEIKAGYRALQRIRNDHPRLAAVIVADSLYSKQPFIEQVRAARFSFLLVAKPEDHTSLYQDIEGLRRGRLLDHRCTIDVGYRGAAERQPPQSQDQLRALPHRTCRHDHLSKRLGDRLGADRWQRSADRACGTSTLEDRERGVQYAEEPGLSPGAQLRPR